MSAATSASSLSNRAIAEYAERVGVHHKVYSSSGLADVGGLVAALGGRVEESNALVAPEALTVYEPGRFTVHLPLVTSDRRDRFTIAHELGHYFLHYLYPKHEETLVFGRGERNRAETEANVFASSLLMPEQKFRDAVQAFGPDWWRIADVFGVSPSAASVRAQVLGID